MGGGSKEGGALGGEVHMVAVESCRHGSKMEKAKYSPRLF